jgi:hypothetical protein
MMNLEKKEKTQFLKLLKLFHINKNLNKLGMRERQLKYIVRFFQQSLLFVINC